MRGSRSGIAAALALAAAGMAAGGELPGNGICAHRGDRAVCPENTVPAFESAVRKGAAMVEFDVARCATGELVVMHDPTINRTTTGTGEVEKLSFAYLRSVDAGVKKDPRFRGVKIPTFDEAIDCFPKTGLWLNVHCKSEVTDEVARKIKEKGRLEQAFVAADAAGVAAARAAVPEIKVCLFAAPSNSWSHSWTAEERRESVGAALAAKADFIQPHEADFTQDELLPFHAAGGKVNFFWCNKPERLGGLLARGIDFPLTDRLDEMQREFDRLLGEPWSPPDPENGFAYHVDDPEPRPWFLNVVPLWQGERGEAFTAAEILRQREQAGLSTFLPSMSFHPQTTPARDLIPDLCGRFRRLKARLTGSGVHLAALVQSLQGHGWNGKVPLTRETWQHVVKIDGSESPRMCSLDPGFRAYTYEAIRALALEGPEFLLIDDDVGVRLGECFCPLHLRAIGKALGREVTLEEMQKLYGSRPLDDPEIAAANRALAESACDYARTSIRAAIDSVDPRMRCGLCACWPGWWHVNALARALAGGTRPFVRVNCAVYGDQHAESLVHAFLGCRAVQGQLDPDIEAIDEADTFPQNYMSESATMLHAHLASGLLSGLVGAKLWVAEFQEPVFTDSQRRYERRLKGFAGFYAKLVELSRGIEWKGANHPVVRPVAGFGGHPRRTPEGIYPTTWGTPLEGLYAIPLRSDGLETGGITVLGPDDVARMGDAQLRWVLSGCALVDSLAARQLTVRGFAPLLGVKATAGGPDFAFQSEWSADGAHSIGHMWDETTSRLEPLPGVKAVASWNFHPGSRFSRSAPLAPSAVRCENAAGGKVVTLGWAFSLTTFKALRPVRRLELLGELDWLNGAPLDAVGTSGDPALVRHGVTKAGDEIVAFFSLSLEVRPTLDLRWHRPVESVERLTAEGAWESVVWSRPAADALQVAVRVDPVEPIVLRIRAAGAAQGAGIRQ